MKYKIGGFAWEKEVEVSGELEAIEWAAEIAQENTYTERIKLTLKKLNDTTKRT